MSDVALKPFILVQVMADAFGAELSELKLDRDGWQFDTEEEALNLLEGRQLAVEPEPGKTSVYYRIERRPDSEEDEH